jgi:hypothetical protein
MNFLHCICQALLCYWVSTNAVSLIQVSLLKIPAIREKCGIEARQEFKTENLPIKSKGFKESFKDCKLVQLSNPRSKLSLVIDVLSLLIHSSQLGKI